MEIFSLSSHICTKMKNETVNAADEGSWKTCQKLGQHSTALSYLISASSRVLCVSLFRWLGFQLPDGKNQDSAASAASLRSPQSSAVLRLPAHSQRSAAVWQRRARKTSCSPAAAGRDRQALWEFAHRPCCLVKLAMIVNVYQKAVNCTPRNQKSLSGNDIRIANGRRIFRLLSVW